MADSESETEAETQADVGDEDEGEKKGGFKKLLIKIVPLLLIAYFVATKTVLAPPPPTAEELKQKAAFEKRELEIKCANANHKMAPPPLEMGGEKEGETTPTTTAEQMAEEETKKKAEHELEMNEGAGPILQLDSVTVNLADGHFLKVGLALQFPHMGAGHGTDELDVGNPGVPALNHVIAELRHMTTKELGPKALDELREDLGYQVCVTPALNAGGQIETIYFTDFVSQ